MTTFVCWWCHTGHRPDIFSYDCNRCGANVRCRNCPRDNGEGEFCSGCGTARGAPSKKSKRCLLITWLIALLLLGLFVCEIDVMRNAAFKVSTGQDVENVYVSLVFSWFAGYMLAIAIYLTVRVGCRPSDKPVPGRRLGYYERFYSIRYPGPYDMYRYDMRY